MPPHPRAGFCPLQSIPKIKILLSDSTDTLEPGYLMAKGQAALNLGNADACQVRTRVSVRKKPGEPFA